MVHLQTNLPPVLTWACRAVAEAQVALQTFSTALLTTFSPQQLISPAGNRYCLSIQTECPFLERVPARRTWWDGGS